MHVTIRNINREADLENFVKFYNLAYADYPRHKDLTVEFVKKYIFDAPDFDEDANFLALEGSQIVGRSRADIHGNAASIIVGVLPELRYSGIEDGLFDAVMDYLAPKKLEIARTSILAQFTESFEYYKAKGFAEKKRQYAMSRDINLPIEAPELPDDIIIEMPDLEKENDAVKDTIDRGFADTMDDTAEMMIYYDKFTERDYFSSEGILVARGPDGNIIGICIGAVHPAMDDSGFIPWLAVLKEHRGKGLGKALLLSSLEWFKTMEKIKKSELSVDLDNPNALKLYKGIGYEVITETILLEKKLA